MDYLLQIFRALGYERRLKIIELLLEKGELSIEEIASAIKIPLATCCRNLKVLERAYLVNSRRKSGQVFYQLNRPNEHPYNRLIIELIKLRRERKFKEK